jgi:nicotinamidase-related amidase
VHFPLWREETLLANGSITLRKKTEADIHRACAVQRGEVIVTKVRASAFSGSDLEVILRSQTISHLVLCGIATSGVVLSTVLEAADKDYDLTVLSDCCADADEEVQRVLMTKIFPRYAEVITAQTWGKKVSEGIYLS